MTADEAKEIVQSQLKTLSPEVKEAVENLITAYEEQFHEVESLKRSLNLAFSRRVYENLIGKRYGRLTVIEFEGTRGNFAIWKCKCDCGNIVSVLAHNLKSGVTNSCGCLKHEILSVIKTEQDLLYSKMRNTWLNIKDRCFNKKSTNYPHYGGRGITMFEGWIDDFEAFYNYVSKLEHFGEKGYSLDRIDNDGNYEQGNLRWATHIQQCNNRRTSIKIEYHGKIMSLKEVADIAGIEYHVIYGRYKRGTRNEELFSPFEKTGRPKSL